MFVTRPQLNKLSFRHINVGDIQVNVVDSVRNLGAVFDSQLSMSNHIAAKCKISFYHLYNLRKIRDYLSRDTCEILVHSLIFSQIDYCNGLLYGLPKSSIAKMQRIQNYAARLICLKPKFCRITPLLLELHWLPVESRTIFKISLFVFKAINKQAPDYICDMFTSRDSGHSLRSSHGPILDVPFTRQCFAGRSLRIAGPNLWNNLPLEIRTISEISEFKSKLKTHLFNQAFFST